MDLMENKNYKKRTNRTKDVFENLSENNRKFWNKFKSEGNISKRSILVYRGVFSRFISFIDHQDITNISKSDINEFINLLIEENLSATTLNRYISVINSFNRFIVDKNMSETITLDFIVPIHQIKKRPNASIFSWEEIIMLKQKILDNTDRYVFNSIYYDGLKLEQIAKKLDVVPATLQNRVNDLGKVIGRDRIIVQDIIAARNKYCVKCTNCQKLYDCDKDNWTFVNNRLVCVHCKDSQ